MPAPSSNTQAVLLLTYPLLQEGGKGSRKDPVLTASEYAQLAACLPSRPGPSRLDPSRLDPSRLDPRPGHRLTRSRASSTSPWRL